MSAAGLGLRRSLLAATEANLPAIDFLELAPENWLDVGGKYGQALARIRAQKPIIAHGLSLSLGGPNDLDEAHLAAIRDFLQRYEIALYSEHLSACTDNAHLYDLMPLPFTADMLSHLCERIRRTQDLLGRRIAVENSSYYVPLAQDFSELEFLQRLLRDADCLLLLDVNNVYVNSVNHGYDPAAFIDALPSDRIAYLHIAGHEREALDLIVDTHGAAVADPVWALLAHTYRVHSVKPTLLERDSEFPPMQALLDELQHIRKVQHERA
jgi:uncharacterized protein